MSAYGFSSPGAVAGPAAALLLALALPLCTRPSRSLSWGCFAAAVAAGIWFTRDEPAGTRMLLLCAGPFFAMKLVVTTEARIARKPLPTGWTWIAFHVLWVGMRPWSFAGVGRAPRPGGGRLVSSGLLVAALGAGLLLVARPVYASWSEAAGFILALLGLGFLVHFGLLRAMAGFWRARGASVGPVCDAPQRSRTLSEFWSRRWNLPFSELMQIGVQRPLRRRIGDRRATACVFLLSGLLHDMALSVPARGGYGLPLAYFALHGVLVRLDSKPSRMRVVLSVLLPVPLLFHPPFLEACIEPLLR